MDDSIRQALDTDGTIDITTTGRKSGRPRRIEIWYRRVNGRTNITGMPGPRDWYANLRANAGFIFYLKESVRADLPARSRPIDDPVERRQILSAPAMAWYQNQVGSVDRLVQGSPLVEVVFDEP